MHADVIFVWYSNAPSNGLFTGRQLDHYQPTTRARTTLCDDYDDDGYDNSEQWLFFGKLFIDWTITFEIFFKHPHDLIRMISTTTKMLPFSSRSTSMTESNHPNKWSKWNSMSRKIGMSTRNSVLMNIFFTQWLEFVNQSGEAYDRKSKIRYGINVTMAYGACW